MNADEYVNKVLAEMPPDTPSRSQIAMELRGNIAERTAAGQPLDDVLRQLGDPAALAAAYLSVEPLESAPVGRRLAAKVSDVVSVLAALVPIGVLLALSVPREALFVVLCLLVFIGGSLTFGVYTVIAEGVWGRTFGKRLMGLRVVRESGARISLGQAVVRQLPMFLQVYWIDAFFALFTEKKQRAFELLSKTRVVSATRQEAPMATGKSTAVRLGAF
jgi:uncharacterized RDD family membrane protein YckC